MNMPHPSRRYNDPAPDIISRALLATALAFAAGVAFGVAMMLMFA